MKKRKRNLAEDNSFGEEAEMNSVICVQSVQVSVHHGKLQLELCVNQDNDELACDLISGKLTSTKATSRTVCSERGDNCSVCGTGLKEKTTTINFTVTALRSVCVCMNKMPIKEEINKVFNRLEFPSVQEENLTDGTDGTINLGECVLKCAKIRKVEKHGELSPFSEGTESKTSRNDKFLSQACHQYMEDKEVKCMHGETKRNLETRSKTIANILLEDLHSKSNSPFQIVSLPDSMDTDDSSVSIRGCEKCGNEIQCKCKGCHLETRTEGDESCATKDKVNMDMCTMCDFQYKDESELKVHHELQHQGETTFKCLYCEMSFSDPKSLKVHSLDHSDVESISRTSTNSPGLESDNKSKKQCAHCKETFLFSSELESHQCPKTKLKSYSCSHCDKTFRTKDFLRKHKTVHSEKKFQCDYCSKSFRRSADLLSHVTLHTGDKKFKCEECSNSFTTKASLKKHLLLHAKEKNFKCDVCSKEYASELQLKNHSKLHNIDTPFICEYCGKQLTTKHYLESHVKTHLEYEKVICHLCGKSYRDPTYLKIHLKSHTGDGLVKCDLCGEHFADPRYITVHKKKFCKANGVKCDECDRMFANKLDLSYHVGVHTGERPFECDICGKGFTKSDRLSSHRKRHFDSEKNHECKTCLKRFVCASDLKKHQKSHSAKKKLSLPEKLKYGMKDVDPKAISKENELPESSRLPLVPVQPVASTEQEPAGGTDEEQIKTFIASKVPTEVLNTGSEESCNVQGEFLQVPLASTEKLDGETVSEQLQVNVTGIANNEIGLLDNIPKNGILDNVTQLPDIAAKFLDNVTQLPNSVTQLPHSMTNNVMKNVTQLPDNVIQLPDNVIHIPDNVTQLPDNVVHMQNITTQLPDNVMHMPDTVTQMLDNITQLPDNAILIKEEIPQNVSYEQGMPDLIQGQLPNTVTILQASGSKIPDNLTLIQTNMSKFNMPNAVTFVPGVSLIPPKAPLMPCSETLLPEDVTMIQKEMSIIEGNVPLDIPIEGMDALQLPDSDVLEDSLTTSMNTSESSLVEHQRLDLSEIPVISLPDETPEDVKMIQKEMSIIEGNVPLDIPNEGMDALQLPDSDVLEDSLTTSMNTSEASLVEHQRLDLSEIPVISLPDETPADSYGTEDSSDPMKSEMLLDTASISSPIHIDSLDPNTSFENALNFEMSDPDQLLGNPYMYKLVFPGKSPSK